MSAELVMRTAGVLACATTLSLITTIAAYAAVHVAPLKWDGTFCTAKECASAPAVARDKRPVPTRYAKGPARAS
jgi:hypothetical protein